MGRELGIDTSALRVHTDPEAGSIARSMQAEAFTHGNDIYFAPGRYQPTSDAGQHMLAHELSHVAAQRSGADRGGAGPLSVGRADDPAEAAADATAGKVVAQLRRSHPSSGGRDTRHVHGHEDEHEDEHEEGIANGTTLRRVKGIKERTEQYQRAARSSETIPEDPSKERAEGIGPNAFAQRAETFSGTGAGTEPESPAQKDIQGAAAGSVGKTARLLNDQAMARLIHEAKDDWPTVKEKYGSDIATMTRLVSYRKRFVDGLIDELRADERFASMKTRAAGSTALTSDYDITFLGINGAAAVQEFNTRFRAHWGKEAGTIFDTNVYAEDVLPPKEQVLSGQDDVSLLGRPMDPGSVDARLDEGLQDVSSLVKVRKNMKRSDWFAFVDTILQALRSNREATAEAASRFADANTIFERTMVPQILKEVESTPGGRKELAKLRKSGMTAQVALVESIMQVDEGIAGSNRVYEAKLLYAAELEVRRNQVDRTQDPRQWNSLTVDLRKAKADAMLFANEPYFSAGTLFHVVGNVQAKFGATLSSAAYFQSLQENYGDTLKELHHLHGKEWRVVAIKASKYVWRTFDAAFQMSAAGVDVSGGLNLGALRDAAKKALDVRQGVAGITADQALEALGAAHIASEDQLKTVLSTLMIAANKVIRGGTSAGGARPESQSGSAESGSAESDSEGS